MSDPARPDASASPAWAIELSDLDYGDEEREAVERVLRSKWLSMGPETRAFEEEFAAEIGVRHAVAVSSGTAALHLAFLALGLGPGDEILQPAVNFVAAANVSVFAGARPVFCDIRAIDDPTIDAADAARRAGPAARALVVMHYGGAACQMDEALALCRERGLVCVEDACHGVGGTWRGRKMGALGDAAAFSFFSNKNLAIGEGGMVTTDRDDVAEMVRALRSHGMTTLTWDRHRGHARSYDVARHGLNYRIDEIRSALGRAQLRKLARNNERRRLLAREYRRLFLGAEGSALRERGWLAPTLGAERDESAHHFMIVVAPDSDARDRAADRLKSRGIQTSVHYPFIPDFSAFRDSGASADPLPLSRQFCSRVLTLPLHPLLTPADAGAVIAALAAAAEA